MGDEGMSLVIEGLEQGYNGKTVIRGVDMDVREGEVVTILGPNGSGKSTMIKTISNIMHPMSGSVSIDGTDIRDIPKKEFAKIVSYVPQMTIYFGNATVYDTVLIGRRPYVNWSYSSKDFQMAADAMIRMKIDDLYDRQVSELSGGQIQRVTIARSLVQDPRYYIFDEPTSALDLRNQLDTLKIMRGIVNEKGASMVIALHDLNLAYRYSDRVLVLKDGSCYDFGETEDVITPKMIRDVYGVDSEIVEGSKGKFIHSYDSELDEMTGAGPKDRQDPALL